MTQSYFISLNQLFDSNDNQVNSLVSAISEQIREDSLVIGFGNGGSASDIEHFIGELTGKFKSANRKPIPAISLTQPASAITAIANDFGYEYVFKRQLEAFVKLNVNKFVVFAVSTSGRSKNVIKALRYLLELKHNNPEIRDKLFIVFLTSEKAKEYITETFQELAKYLNVIVYINEKDTDWIQTGHYILFHRLCRKLEEREDLNIQKLTQ